MFEQLGLHSFYAFQTVNGWMTVCFLDSILHVVEAFVAVQLNAS